MVQQWFNEGAAVIADIKAHVNRMEISEKLKTNKEGVYFNLETKEAEKYCIEMSVAGFRICANSFDTIAECSNYFETIYSLLDSISTLYRQSFGNALIDKLNQIE
ncbi:GSK3-beta interaction protein-like protein [Leptotrombidium deliense]|uniref:GSK3-beta interaction protein-like protein n=1 Tax=Leptotrombidium deliense TaxID=299467 RepID=A0A443SDF0_9ACAR|nr:GSK3-beta interaction protein-like protein [Leptotrombidium deliense]